MGSPGDGPERTDPADLPRRCAEVLLDAAGRIVDPLLLVDLDRRPAPDEVAAATAAVAGSDRIVVGVCRSAPAPALAGLVSALDLTVVPRSAAYGRELVAVPDPDAEAAALHGAAAADPAAAVVLAGLLRWTGRLPVPAALDAESLACSTLLAGPEFRRWLQARGPHPLPPPAAADPVRVERTGDRLRITLDRPQRRNAYGRELRAALVDALDAAALDPDVAVVRLDGAGTVFCGGSDLDEFGTTPDPVPAHFVRTRGGAALALHRLATRLRGRLEARLHGACVGPGVELPAFAGRVVADPETTFRLPEIGMGLIPGVGGTVGIPRRIGRWRTLHLALSGRVLDAPTALAWGLVDEIAPV
jgi:enoyl-CoA hydratase/carnithine racemase